MTIPEFGYDSPRKTWDKCKNPQLADEYCHLIGLFAEDYLEEGNPGYSIIRVCVGCGKNFGKVFKPSRIIKL